MKLDGNMKIKLPILLSRLKVELALYVGIVSLNPDWISKPTGIKRQFKVEVNYFVFTELIATSILLLLVACMR